MDDHSLGLYLHLPFCERVCPYCDFAVVAARPLRADDEERYVRALCAELERRAGDFAGRALASLYLGGGTPSLCTPASIARLVAVARAAFPESEAPPEVTLEVNPSTLERERLVGFREAGVGRLSLGLQCFDDAVLRALGRAHRGDEGRATFAAAREAGFENVSVDLLFGAPQQSLASLEADLAEMIALAPEHVSTYELIVEPDTPFELAAARDQLARPEDDEIADMMEGIDARLRAAGYERYELASYARPGFQSVHNSRYWSRAPVLGVGLGAHSNEPPAEAAPFGRRRANTRNLARYLERVEAGASPERELEVLDASTARGEAIFLGLRRSTGLEAAGFAVEFGAPPRAFFASEIDALLGSGLLAEGQGGDLRLTRQGRLLADTVSQHFV